MVTLETKPQLEESQLENSLTRDSMKKDFANMRLEIEKHKRAFRETFLKQENKNLLSNTKNCKSRINSIRLLDDVGHSYPYSPNTRRNGNLFPVVEIVNTEERSRHNHINLAIIDQVKRLQNRSLLNTDRVLDEGPGKQPMRTSLNQTVNHGAMSDRLGGRRRFGSQGNPDDCLNPTGVWAGEVPLMKISKKPAVPPFREKRPNTKQRLEAQEYQMSMAEFSKTNLASKTPKKKPFEANHCLALDLSLAKNKLLQKYNQSIHEHNTNLSFDILTSKNPNPYDLSARRKAFTTTLDQNLSLVGLNDRKGS
jgi:hypothetical protein